MSIRSRLDKLTRNADSPRCDGWHVLHLLDAGDLAEAEAELARWPQREREQFERFLESIPDDEPPDSLEEAIAELERDCGHKIDLDQPSPDQPYYRPERSDAQ